MMTERDDRGSERGIGAETPLATPEGWFRAGRLRPGNWLSTDRGPRRLTATARGAAQAAVLIPEGALGEHPAFLLLPGQPVLLNLPQAQALHGAPQAMVPAQALIGWRGICLRAAPPAVRLWLEAPACVLGPGGLMLAAEGGALPVSLQALAENPVPPELTRQQARHLMACTLAEEAGRELARCA